MALLEIQDLTVTIHQDGTKTDLVRAFHTIEAGETLALVGESGSGNQYHRWRLWGFWPNRLK